MPALHKIKGELQTIRRGYKLLYSTDRDVILYKALRALIAVISPYTTLYFTSQLINGIAAKKAFGQLMGYAVFIVGINLNPVGFEPNRFQKSQYCRPEHLVFDLPVFQFRKYENAV